MKLSIITINKNNVSGLIKTCISVITQTFTDFEWIIIDGASNDNSIEIIKQYSDRVTYWVSEPDSGIYNAMNKGIKKAQGEFCLFLNSGDFILHPWTLQEVIDEINVSKYADVYFSDTVINTYDTWKYPQELTLNFFKKATISHQNSLIHRNLFDHQLYNENYRIISDWYFFITEFVSHNISFVHIKTNIAVFDISGVGITQDQLNKNEKKKAFRELNIKERNYFFIVCMLVFTMIKYIFPYGFYKLYQLLKLSREKKDI